MTTYAIGDIQGCFHAFQALLAKIKFNPQTDKLWLVGDLINRGSGSLEVLRWCYQNQDNIKVVLGNHDLHAIAVAHGYASPHKSDTLDALLIAEDHKVLFDWLRHQYLVYQEGDYLMVHAGLLPQWSVAQAMQFGAEVEATLQSTDYHNFLMQMYGNQPNVWDNNLTGIERLRVITNAMTRLRVCTAQGAMEFSFKGELPDVPAGLVPWFDVPERASQDTQILFGHWSALGLHTRNNVYALDTGCLWGGQLTAMNLQSKVITQVPSHPQDQAVRVL